MRTFVYSPPKVQFHPLVGDDIISLFCFFSALSCVADKMADIAFYNKITSQQIQGRIQDFIFNIITNIPPKNEKNI